MVGKADLFERIASMGNNGMPPLASSQVSRILTNLKSSKWLLLMLGMYSAVMSYVVLLRFDAFQTHAFDLGIFNQAFSTALQGKLFYETPDQYLIPSGSFLGVHFNLLMFLLLPIYAVYPHPETLLLLQTSAVALGAVPIYLVARRVIHAEKLALVMALVYLLNPAITNLNLYDFHLEAFLPFFLGMFFYCYISGSWRSYVVFLALSLFTIDFAPLIVVAICIAHALRTLSKRPRYHLPLSFALDKSQTILLISTIVVSLAAFYLSLYLSLIISGKPVSVQGALSTFVNLGQNLQLVFAKSEFWVLCLIPLMFLPLLVPSQLVMVAPWFFVTLLEGAYATSYSFGYQDAGAFVVPYLILAAVFAIEALHKQRVKLRGFFICIFMFSLFISPFNPLMQNRIPGIAYEQGFPVVTAHDQILDAAIGLVPPNASILTQNNIFPQVSGRADSFLYIPNMTSSIEYILADSKASTYAEGISTTQTMKQFLPYLVSEEKYGVVVNDDGVLLLEANYTGPVLLAGGTSYTFNYQTLDLAAGSLRSDSTSTSGTILVHSADESEGTFWYGPYASLPPGEYSATFVLKTTAATSGSLYLQVDNFVNSTSAPILVQQQLNQTSFSNPGSWTSFTLTFSYTPQESAGGRLEFRGVDAVGGPFSLDYVDVTYVSPFNA
jgi:uncharacterized membrane protein